MHIAYLSFALETADKHAVLLYDSLWHPTKLAYNLEFIQTGLSCLRQMVDAEPILNAVRERRAQPSVCGLGSNVVLSVAKQAVRISKPNREPVESLRHRAD